MRRSTKLLPVLVLGIAGAIPAANSALAVPITYTETATATGSLNNVPFTSATVTLTMNNDTTNVISGGPGIFDNIGTLTLNVTGFPIATFTDTTQAVANQTGQLAGFGDLTINRGILFTMNPAFSTYDLTTFIGPLSGPPVLSTTTTFPTSDGPFTLTSVASTAFSATPTPAIPDPNSLILLTSALAGLGLIGGRIKS